MKNKPIILIGIGVVLIAGSILLYVALSGHTQTLGPNDVSFPEGSDVDRIIGDDELPTISPSAGPYTRLSRAPVSGYIPFTREVIDEETGSTTINTFVRFVDTTTGHIHEVDISSPLSIEKITNTTIPKTFDAQFLTPSEVVFRYIDESDGLISYLARINEGERVFDGIYLPANLRALSVEAGGALSLQPNENGSSGIIYSTDGGVRQIGTFPLRDLDVLWEAPTLALVWSRPSYNVSGYVYRFNPETGGASVVVRDARGATVSLSPQGSYLAYTNSSREGHKMYVENLDSGSQIELPFFSLGEKCAWSENEANLFCAVPSSLPLREVPDVWYRGQVRFDDVLYRASREDSFSAQEYIWDPGEDGLVFDMHKLTILGEHLFFIDKITGTLGVIDLSQ